MQTLLNQLGFREKETQVYEALLDGGPLSVRKLAAATGLNRGSVYDALKSLREQGLVTYYHQRKRQYFAAEDPGRISLLLEERQHSLDRAQQDYAKTLPSLRARYGRSGGKPASSYYEGDRGVRDILNDLLTTVADQRTRAYSAYSSSAIKQHLYRAYPQFTKKRIAAQIRVRVVSFGPGGRLVGLDERRWLSKRESAPTYTLLYGNRVALISIDERRVPRGTVITDAAVAKTQQAIFHAVWNSLPQR